MEQRLSERLRALLERSDENVCLAEAALLVAAGEYPDLDVPAYLDRIQQYADVLRERLGATPTVQESIGAMNRYLFHELGFGADRDNYYDPRNTFLNDVLERRRGIPISLSVLYIAVGRRLGLDLKGVSFPGHFLVKCPVDGGVVVIDPFYGGVTLSLEDLQKRLREFRGGEVSRAIVSEMLVAAAPREVVMRMLRNLKGIYLKGKQLHDALAVLEWIVSMNPRETEEIRDRGVVYQELECFRAALADFEHYLALKPEAPDADMVRERVVEMQKQTVRLN
ncbi:MAG: tetratricopeptide repeat protein [Burkholderiales bacterium]|nr:tetratricopeptide repeat protein [Burkholderiales bacterium]